MEILLTTFIPSIARFPVFMIMIEIILVCFFGGLLWASIWSLFSGGK